MSISTESFFDTDGDEFVGVFDTETGRVTFNEFIIFDEETTLEFAQFLVRSVNSLTPEPMVEAANPRQLAVEVTGSTARESFNLTAFQAAKELGLSVEFKYSKGNVGGIETRTLAEIDSVHETAKGHTVVTGYDEDREDPRMFRVDWVKGFVTVTD